MLKESILFVASTGLLIYFISPSDEPHKAEPVKEQVQKQAKPLAPASDDGWGDDEDEYDSEGSFTFGEPMTDPDDDEDEQALDEDDRSDRQEQADNQESKSTARGKNRSSGRSPGSGEPGSIDNPIVFKTNNPENPEDD